MEIISTGWHVFGALLVFLLGAFTSLAIASRFGIGDKRGLFLYLWHTLWCLVYLIYAINAGGDSLFYYSESISGELKSFRLGTVAVIYFTHFFSDFVGLSILGVFLVNNIIGFIGLLGFAGALKKATVAKSSQLRLLALVIILLPSVSFWSSAIGKDSIAFMAAGLALWAALDLRRRVGLMIFAVLSMFFVRAHMAAMMVIALSATFIIDANISMLKRFFFGMASLSVATLLIPFALEYAGVGDVDADGLISYVEARQGYNQEGGGGVDIAPMSLPVQLFTYMFRPLVFEARSVFHLGAAVDNLVLAILFMVGGLVVCKRRKSRMDDARVFLWVYALFAWIVLAMTTANLGIAMRQKWMFAPMLIYLMISVMGQSGSNRHSPRISTGHISTSVVTGSGTSGKETSNA
ncbi:hypothetical protein [Haliea sp.]